MTALKGFVIDILRSRDFQVTEQGRYLLAKKGEIEVAVCPIGTGEEPILPAFLDDHRSFKGKKLVASVVPLPEIPPDKIDPNLIIWDREALEHEIGRTHLEWMVGDRDHGLVDELTADDYPRIMTAADLTKLEGAEVGERIIRPTIDPQDVKEIGMRTVGGFRQKLELVPYFVFDYACPIYLGIELLGEERGKLGVNALTKRVERWDDRLEVVYALEQGHRKAEPTFGEDLAEDMARKEAVRLHTAEREVVRETGNATLTERKRVVPRTEDVRLEGKGLFYLPVWCVEGIHGVMVINAGTGKVISEDYYRI